MKIISVTVKSKKLPIEKVWDLITDVEKYPERVKYVKSVRVYGRGKGSYHKGTILKEGSRWDDTTTILWIPIKIKHTITTIRKNKEYGFDIPLYLGGQMKQKYILSEEDPKTVLIKGTISYDLGNTFLDKSVGFVLNWRLKKMLESSARFVNGEVL